MRRLSQKYQSKPNILTQQKRIDWSLIATVFALVGFGLIMVYDSSVIQAFKDYNDKYFYIKQQLIWVGLGLFGLIFASFFNYQNYRKLALPMFLFSFLLLLAVLIPGLG